MIGEFNSDRQEVWYLETSTLTVAVCGALAPLISIDRIALKLDAAYQIDG
jgi:hypothetical protein